MRPLRPRQRRAGSALRAAKSTNAWLGLLVVLVTLGGNNSAQAGPKPHKDRWSFFARLFKKKPAKPPPGFHTWRFETEYARLQNEVTNLEHWKKWCDTDESKRDYENAKVEIVKQIRELLRQVKHVEETHSPVMVQKLIQKTTPEDLLAEWYRKLRGRSVKTKWIDEKTPKVPLRGILEQGLDELAPKSIGEMFPVKQKLRDLTILIKKHLRQ